MMIFMFAIFLPVLIIITVMLANETKPKKNIVLGVTLPYSARSDERVEALCASFRRRLWLAAAVLTLALVPGYFLPRASLQMGFIFIWLLFAMAVPCVIRIKANRRLTALKKSEGWTTPASGKVVLDIGGTPGELGRPLSRWLFVPAVLVSLVPFFLSLCQPDEATRMGGAILSVSFALCSGLSIVLYPLIFRQKRDVVGADSSVNAALTRVRRYNWGKVWITLSYLSAVFALAVWFLRNSELWTMLSAAAYTVILLGLCMNAEFSARRAQERLTAAAGDGVVDDDVWWIWGMLYCNPNDSHVFINDRVGTGMSMNIGRPAGKAVMGFALLCILMMPVLGGWFIAVDYVPRTAEVTESELVYTHLTEKYVIGLDGITSAQLLKTLPSAARTAGTGMDTLLEGRFTVSGYGDCRISLDPTSPPFIAVITSDGLARIFNLMTPEETTALYEILRSVT